MKFENPNRIPIFEIFYESKKEKVFLKSGAGGIQVKKFPTDKGFNDIISKIKNTLDSKTNLKFNNVYFRVFNFSRINNALLYGSDRANQMEKRKFDIKEWELYPFRLRMDYMFTNKKGELTTKDGALLKNLPAKTFEDLENLEVFRKDVYSGKNPDKEVVEYYNRIIKKYRKLEKDKNSKYYELYMKLKKVKKDFPMGDKVSQPEFFLTEKMAMKKMKLMRDDVTFVSNSNIGGLKYVLTDALKKRVTEKIAVLALYNDLVPVHERKARGGEDCTFFFTFRKCRINSLKALFLLIPK